MRFSHLLRHRNRARDWGQPAERRNLGPALRDSYERLFHATGMPRFWLDLQEQTETNILLAKKRLERAIGVIYRAGPSAEVIASQRACPSSLMLSFTSTKLKLLSRWSALLTGRQRNCRRPIQARSRAAAFRQRRSFSVELWGKTIPRQRWQESRFPVA